MALMTTEEVWGYYSSLIGELGRMRDEVTDAIPVFRYSDDLIDFMNGYEVTDPNDAYDLLVELQEEVPLEYLAEQVG